MEPKKIDGDETAMRETMETPGVHNSGAVWQTRETYCEPGFKGIFTSYYVALCAVFAALGGLLFGYDQGVVSVILTEEQFLTRFTRIDEGSGNA
ncbi:hypothetical protein KC343_g23369, partial [Hortaea werneckii]